MCGPALPSATCNDGEDVDHDCRLVQRTKSPNPSLRLQAIVEEILQAYIFPRADSAHKQYQNWA